MDVAVPGKNRAEGLNGRDHSGNRFLLLQHGLIDLFHRFPRGATKLAEKRSVVPEVQPKPFWNREDELPVWNVFENLLGKMLRECQNSLLMTGWTDAPFLTGKRDQNRVATARASRFGETMFRNATLEVLLNRLADYRPPESKLRLIPLRVHALEFIEVLGDEFV